MARSSRTTEDRCPCGSGSSYLECCGRWHSGEKHLMAPTAEQLMRSRYSAFARHLGQYLLDTWHPSRRPSEPIEFDDAVWTRLSIRSSRQIDGDHAEVEYVAVCKAGGRAFRLHERSRFVREDSRWYYVDGDILE